MLAMLSAFKLCSLPLTILGTKLSLVMCLVLSALHFMPTWEMGRRNVSVAPDSSLISVEDSRKHR